MVTELGTGLGLLGSDEIDQVLATRPAVMRSLSPEDWDLLDSLRAGGAYDAEFHAAWENGRAFLEAREGLRGRRPEVVEWKGALRAAGDEVAPVDLRIDHVYLVSCKYLSDILFNVSPTHVFDDLLVGGQGRRGRGTAGDWYAEVAPVEYQHLYEAVRAALVIGEDGALPRQRERLRTERGPGPVSLPGLEGPDVTPSGVGVVAPALGDPRRLPARADQLTTAHRAALGQALKAGWPTGAKVAYGALSARVAQASADRWHDALAVGRGADSAMLWRLLRMGSAPYFVLGSSTTHSLRLRIATPWDWRQLFTLDRLEINPQKGGQPRVGWTAIVRERSSGRLHEIAGHVEIRWSHGRFAGPPEAKGYVDTAHHLIPGYFALQ
jgi:hypothetical protein